MNIKMMTTMVLAALAAGCCCGKKVPENAVRVICEISIKDGCRDEYIKAVKEVMPLVHAEKGCIEYVMVEDTESDLSAQFPIRPNHFTMIECWESAEALKAHLGAEHMKEFSKKVRPLRNGSQLFVTKEAK